MPVSKQIGDLIVANPGLLPKVKRIIYDRSKELLTAFSASDDGEAKEHVRFVEAGEKEGGAQEVTTATHVHLEDLRAFIQTVEQASDRPFVHEPLYDQIIRGGTKEGQERPAAVADPNRLIWFPQGWKGTIAPAPTPHGTDPEPE